jgi:hypothetical protein
MATTTNSTAQGTYQHTKHIEIAGTVNIFLESDDWVQKRLLLLDVSLLFVAWNRESVCLANFAVELTEKTR